MIGSKVEQKQQSRFRNDWVNFVNEAIATKEYGEFLKMVTKNADYLASINGEHKIYIKDMFADLSDSLEKLFRATY